MKRRHFLFVAGAGIASAKLAWADIGSSLYLTAGNRPDNSAWLVGVSLSGEIRFTLPLPSRGHAAAAHPFRAEAVAFARRPGNFALVLDCGTGREIARLSTPEGSHFYGHGAFTADGRHLLTTENAYDVPEGRIGIWDVERGYQRVGDVPSGGLGPHEIIRLRDGHFAVANGGIQTHPDFQRAKLNIPTMQTNLSILSESGEIMEKTEFPDDMRQNSIRHIDTDGQGNVIAALQWQGAPGRVVPLVARFAPGGEYEFLSHPDTARLKQYAGSISVSALGDRIAVTGPKGDHVLFLDGDGRPLEASSLPVASGVAKAPGGFLITCAGGLVHRQQGRTVELPVDGGWSWDNHLVRVS
ncbi:DUF1513 domain-containing protein [Aliiruegeria lutimaris]|uniref:DUF1513 domain-containing protein n=1 Tax=Aliiruegeria lutimaris TaxID=571298 RepID=A0A1G9I508_9RHOB|nr:DUF1513 domain-containing protein [Aliiruegeria lutimaris]SDL20135.1 hypothetical protein SAMN04488026_107218 [Aliiruegeria lutimaris]